MTGSKQLVIKNKILNMLKEQDKSD